MYGARPEPCAGVHTLRPPTAEECAELEQCLQETAETITAIAAHQAKGARRAGAVERNRDGVVVLPDLLPGDKNACFTSRGGPSQGQSQGTWAQSSVRTCVLRAGNGFGMHQQCRLLA